MKKLRLSLSILAIGAVAISACSKKKTNDTNATPAVTNDFTFKGGTYPVTNYYADSNGYTWSINAQSGNTNSGKLLMLIFRDRPLENRTYTLTSYPTDSTEAAMVVLDNNSSTTYTCSSPYPSTPATVKVENGKITVSIQKAILRYSNLAGSDTTQVRASLQF